MKKAFMLAALAWLAMGVTFAGTIKVTAPDAPNVSICLGMSYTITWSEAGISGNVKIRLVKSGGAIVGIIHPGLPAGTLSYAWTAGSHSGGTAAAGSNYKIRISAINDPADDVSDNAFELKACSGLTPVVAKKVDTVIHSLAITVKAPKTGNYWDGDATETIRWETYLKKPLKVELYNYNGSKFVRKIAEALAAYPSDGKWSHPWKIPTDINPGWYQVRVSSMDNQFQGFSTKFFIRQELSQNKYSLSATTTNKYKYRIKRKKEFTMSPKIYDDPGPGKIRVGYNGFTSDHTDYAVIYRSHAAFNTDAYKGKGLLLKAKLSFKHFMGCTTPPKVYFLEQAWNGDAGALFTVSCGQVPDPANVTQVVQGWLAYPETNHGFVFVGPNESMAYANGECVGFFDSVKLELEFLTTD